MAASPVVIAGLDPAISRGRLERAQFARISPIAADGRVKPGHDEEPAMASYKIALMK
jgi:hypothetical protein